MNPPPPPEAVEKALAEFTEALAMCDSGNVPEPWVEETWRAYISRRTVNMARDLVPELAAALRASQSALEKQRARADDEAQERDNLADQMLAMRDEFAQYRIQQITALAACEAERDAMREVLEMVRDEDDGYPSLTLSVRAAIDTALAAAGPTDAMVEAGARVLAPHLWDEEFLPKLRAVSDDDNFAGSGLDVVETCRLYERKRARAAYAAMSTAWVTIDNTK